MAKFEFPGYVSIVGAAKNDFAMTLDKIYPMVQKTPIDTGGDPRAKLDPVTLLKNAVECQVSDAILLLTPFFRIAGGSPSFPNGLATARFSLIADNEIYILDGQVENHLADLDGNLPEAAKLDFSNPKKGVCLANMYSGSGTIPGSTFGYFLLHGTPITIEIRGIAAGYGKVEMEAGLVAALYTTRAGKKGGA